MHLDNGGAHVEDELQCLRHHQAVELGVRQHVRAGQVADDRRSGVGRREIQDILSSNSRCAETAGVRIVTGFQHPACNVRRMRFQKSLDVIAVDRRPAVEPEGRTDRCDAIEIAEIDGP